MQRLTRSSFASLSRWRTRPVCVAGAALASALVFGCSSSEDEPSPGEAGSGSGGSPVGSAGSASAGTGGSPSSGGAGGSLATGGSATGGSATGGGAGAGGGSGALCPEGALFCDGFEDNAVGALAGPWRTSTNQATVNVDEMQAFSGSKAVHVNAPQAGTYHRGYFALDEGPGAGIFPAVAQEMYGRAMVYLADYPNADVHWTFIQGEGRAADDTHNALYRYGGQHEGGAQLMANYETTMPVGSDCWDHSSALLPEAEWTCVEWRFAVATNEMQFWLNGTELSDIHVTGMGEGCVAQDWSGQWIAPPAFTTLYLGWEHYQQTMNPIDLWMDDVVVDEQRIGCPTPQ